MEETTNDNLGAGASVPQAPETTPPTVQAGSEPSVTPDSGTQGYQLPEKFKDVDSLVKSYTELEKSSSKDKQALKTAQERAAIVDRLEKLGYKPDEIAEQINALEVEQTTKQPGYNPEYDRQTAVTRAQLKKMQYAFEADKLLGKHPELSAVQEQLQELFMSKEDMTLEEIAESYYKPVMDSVRNQASQQLEEKASANVQSAQGSGPEVSDEYKKRRAIAEQTGTVEDVAKLMEAKMG